MPVFKTRQIINSKSQRPPPLPHLTQAKNFGSSTAVNVCAKMHIFLATMCDCLHVVPRRNDEAPAFREMCRYTADESDTTTSVKRLRS